MPRRVGRRRGAAYGATMVAYNRSTCAMPRALGMVTAPEVVMRRPKRFSND